LGFVEGEDCNGVDGDAVLAVEFGEVKEDALGEVGFAGGLVFEVDEDGVDGLGVGDFVGFYGYLDEDINGFSFAVDDVGEVLLG
jgi:hypothetical protein